MALVVKNPPANAGVRDVGLTPGLGRSPGEGLGNPLQDSCLENPWTEEPGGQQSTGVTKSWTVLEGNGTHSSTLAWKIPWTEEPGRLQSMGSLRVGHD